MTSPDDDAIHAYGVTDDGRPIAVDDPGTLAREARDAGTLASSPSRTLRMTFRRSVHDLASAGWALLVPETWSKEQASAVREALAPLLARRHAEAGELFVDAPVPADITGTNFLARAGTRGSLWSPVDPRPGRLPYYVLLVGGPEDLPFSVQCELSLQYAVGRLHFAGDRDEQLAAYRRYAERLVAHEDALAGAPGGEPGLTLMGTRDDAATLLSWHKLLGQLAEQFAVDRLELTGAALPDHLSRRSSRPEILLTACHGRLCRDPAEAPQLQGALAGALEPDDAGGRRRFFAAADVSPSWDLGGLVSIHLACHGAGSPAQGDVPPRVARLAQTLLSTPRPSLAFIGHLDAAWSTSFVDHTQANRPSCATHYVDLVERLRRGFRVGAAFDELTQRRLSVAAELTEQLRDLRGFPELDAADEVALATRWTAELDARNFILLGDPAARLVLPSADHDDE